MAPVGYIVRRESPFVKIDFSGLDEKVLVLPLDVAAIADFALRRNPRTLRFGLNECENKAT